jgi:hypothetical protein
MALAALGHDDRALASLQRGPRSAAASLARGLVLLRTGRSREADAALEEALAHRPLAADGDGAARIATIARTARALARMGDERPHDSLLVIGPELGQAGFAAVRLVASFVTGDTAGARAALRRIPDSSALAGFRDAVAPALVAWSESKRREGRALVARAVATRDAEWDYLVPLGRYAAGHLDDLDAWIEAAAPRTRLDRVWQLYALERAARERHNADRGDEVAALRRRICRP